MQTRVVCTLHLLGEADSSNIIHLPLPSDGSAPKLQLTNNANRNDGFERYAERLPTPGVTPSDLWPTGLPSEIRAGWAKDIPGVRRCQEWTTDLIAELVKRELLPAAAIEVARTAPRRR